MGELPQNCSFKQFKGRWYCPITLTNTVYLGDIFKLYGELSYVALKALLTSLPKYVLYIFISLYLYSTDEHLMIPAVKRKWSIQFPRIPRIVVYKRL